MGDVLGEQMVVGVEIKVQESLVILLRLGMHKGAMAGFLGRLCSALTLRVQVGHRPAADMGVHHSSDRQAESDRSTLPLQVIRN